METKPFAVEEWMLSYENGITYNLAETSAEPLTLRELLALNEEGSYLLDHLLDTKFTYGEVLGSEALRREISRLYPSEDPQEILVTHGAIEANYLVLHALVSPGDTAIVTFPAYQQLYQVPEFLGAAVKRWVLEFDEGFCPDLDRLERLVDDRTRLIVINNPHNPTGTILRKDDLERIASIASQAGASILCDEVYRGFFWDGDCPTLAEIDTGAAVTGSLSKSFSLAGLRIGWIRAPKEILHRCRFHQDYVTIGPPLLSDRLALQAMKNREKILSRNIQMVKENRLLLEEWIAQEPHVRWVPPGGGTTALLKYDFKIPSRTICMDLINKMSTLLVPGECFEMEGSLRIGYGCKKETLEKGLAHLSEYFRTL